MSENDRIIKVNGKTYNLSKLSDEELIILQNYIVKYGNSLMKEMKSKDEEVNHGEY